jgi:hypothetical protein
MAEKDLFAGDPIFRLDLPVTEDEAYESVSRHLADQMPSTELVIHMTPSGLLWIYSYQSAKYLRTDDVSEALSGNAPILIDTVSGEAFMTGTAEPIVEYVAAYRRSVADKK